MIDLELEKANFKNHRATFTKYKNVKILDFKNPNHSYHRIRFIFEEDYCKLHISGDLGELIATNPNNMTYEGFWDFVHNTRYFEEKIDCYNREIYRYDIEKARIDIMKLVEIYDLSEELGQVHSRKSREESINDVIDEILSDFDSRTGIGHHGYEFASDYILDFFEVVSSIGKEYTGILELYMLAFELAYKQLN